MATKRVSPEKKTSEKKTPRRKTNAIADTDAAPFTVVESAQGASTDAALIDPERRRELVAAEAYFRAEKRGFIAGHELDDWVAAEAAVDSRVQRMQVA